MEADAGGDAPKAVLVVHGGAGTILRENMTPERERQCTAALEESLRAGHAVLNSGGTSRDAVETSVRLLEDSPLFNAGRGAVFTHDGRNELDASMMDGQTMGAGAVAGVTTVRNPISAARAVLEKSPHVFLIGHGAEQFAARLGLEIVEPVYFRTEERWAALQNELRQEEEAETSGNADRSSPDHTRLSEDAKFGTVGAVARDRNGNLAAGTSTGGMTNKRYGRVGDSPVIGAGTYADNTACAVSATGHGEYFIRYAVAHDIAALMAYKGLSVEQAADEVIQRKLKSAGGKGGVIALDARGDFAMPFNTEGMYRGYITEEGVVQVSIYGV